MRYTFIQEHRPIFSIRAMCRCLRVHPSGFYGWLKNLLCKRAKEDKRQTDLIEVAWNDSGKIYGYRKLHWAMQSRQPTDLVLQALLMAVWRRKPTEKVLIHSDQGSQFTSIEWASFLKQHNLEHSMSRRGN